LTRWLAPLAMALIAPAVAAQDISMRATGDACS
jgi:hypothetical protein